MAVRRGHDLASSLEEASLTLLTVQPPSEDEDIDPEAEGKGLINSVAHEAGLGSTQYKSEIFVSDEVRGTLLNAVEDYDIVFIGATRSTAITQALFGSIPEEIGEHAKGTVIFTRGSEYRPRTVTEGIIERLSR